MYVSRLNARDRGGALAAVIAIHVALGLAFLNLSGKITLVEEQPELQVFDMERIEPPPPTPPPPEQQRSEPERAEEPEGAASPENIRSQATPIVAPEPQIELPVRPPVATTRTPNEGAAPTQGAGDQPGPGTGAGGTGTGTGAGGSGSGTGGGGGGVVARAQLLTPSLRPRDYPNELRRRWPRGSGPFVIFTVQPNGRVTNCRTYQSSGDPEIDEMTCRLVTARFVYRPALNERGEPVASQMAYRQGL